MVGEFDDDDGSVAIASRRPVLVELIGYYMTACGVDQGAALEMALGRVRRRYAWLTLRAIKREFRFSSWRLVRAMIEGRPQAHPGRCV